MAEAKHIASDLEKHIRAAEQSGATGALSSKVALISGGSSGIGLATALLFAREGTRVAILARRTEKLYAAALEIEDTVGKGSVHSVACDVTDEAQVADAFRTTMQVFGRLDIVVNNAGYGYSVPLEETSVAELQKVLAVHVVGYFLVGRQAVELLKQNATGGSIVFVCSDSSVKAGKRTVAYSSAKAAELHMARCMAEEFGQHKIRVNSVLPGAVFGRSEMWTPEYRKSPRGRVWIRLYDPGTRIREERRPQGHHPARRGGRGDPVLCQ